MPLRAKTYKLKENKTIPVTINQPDIFTRREEGTKVDTKATANSPIE
jgi:hypothetical protein